MTIINPTTPTTAVNMAAFPEYHKYSNVSPFTVQDGSTFLMAFTDWRAWIRDVLVPHIDNQINWLDDSWRAQSLALMTAVNAAIEAAEQNMTEQLEDQTVEFNALVQQIINSSIEMQDPVLTGIISDIESSSRLVLDTLYSAKSVQTTVESGRLSEAALTDAAIKRAPNEFKPLDYMTPAEKTDFYGDRLLDSTPYIQKAITAAAKAGGGVVNLPPGKLLNKSTLIMLSNVVLRGNGTTLLGRGSGLGNGIDSGYLDDAGNPISNYSMFTDDSGTPSGNGDPKYHCSHAVIEGIRFDGYYAALRLHWWTGEGQVNRNWFTNISYRAVRGSYSWGSQYRGNTFESTLHLSHFVDWTIIEGNSFNAKNTLGVGLLIGNGGCWTTTIRNNGFHWHVVGEGTGIKFEGGARNVNIESNHFESNWRHIYGSAQTLQSLTIHNNHLAATPVNLEFTKVKALEFLSLRDSFIGYNDFELGGVTVDAFDAKIILNTDSTFYNKVLLQSHPTNGIVDLAKCTIRSTNLVESFGGMLFNGQPSLTPLAGTSGLTFEKYDAKYNFLANTLPGCTVTVGVNTVTIDTFIDSDAVAVIQPAYFFIRLGGATKTYRVAGRIAGRYAGVVFDAREDLATGTANPTVTLSNNAGKLRIVLTGMADATNNTSGFVKAI